MVARIMAVVTLVIFVAGCQSTSETDRAKPRGFLGDYSMLKPGQEGQAQLVYVDPAADFAAYPRVILEPVTFWFSHNTKMNEVPAEDRTKLAQHLGWAVREALEKDYEFVEASGPGVMRLRFAITELSGAGVVGDVVSTVLPLSRVISAGKKLVTGTNSWVGKAGIELEIVDSLTGKRLGAAVDERAGGKTLEGMGKTWDDVEQAFKFWAGRLATRLGELRAGKH